MIDHSQMPLGKQRARHDPRTLQLADYLDTTALPPAPKSCDWGAKIPEDGWGMMLNDEIGDCTCAAAAHLIQDWTSNDGTLVTLKDADVLKAYEAVSGYDPKTGVERQRRRGDRRPQLLAQERHRQAQVRRLRCARAA